MKLTPNKARPLNADSAWWYDERGAISVYVSKYLVTLSCKIRRADLVKFIERSKPRKRK